ncbi:hypothetical protein NC981_17615 [Leptolyngbya sp. DQ-M1]|uniref:hypothetical protein n=1 Tax=Leptolyngbya sp. DQ-M1 TaxID=2933920 RepID=UPI0032987B28
MSITEHETTIAFDYEQKQVRIFTTRSGVVNQIQKRSSNQAIVQGSNRPLPHSSWKLCTTQSS